MIQTRQLTKQYGELTAVNQLDITVNEGDIVGFLGPNGSGKTTTLLMLMGLSVPTSGTATVGGYSIVEDSKAVRQIAAMLPEGAGYYDDMTAKQNLRYIGQLNDIPADEIEKRIDVLLEDVGLTKWADTKVGTFSNGMKQRLGISEVLIKQPKVAFFDEPTLGLDPKATKELRDILIRLNKENGLTIMLSSHLLHEVKQTCKKIIVLQKGKMVLSDTMENLCNQLENEGEITLEFELTETPSKLVQSIKGIDGVSSVEKEKRKLFVHTKQAKTREISETITKHGSVILLMKPKEYSVEDIFLKYYEGD